MKVFLAEDDMNIVVIAKMALETIGGHEIEMAHDGATALEKISSGNYDLILLDEMMPKMNGRDVCDEYAKLDRKHDPVIFMSANNRELDARDPRPPVIGFIGKPFDPMSLNQQIEDLLAAKRAG